MLKSEREAIVDSLDQSCYSDNDIREDADEKWEFAEIIVTGRRLREKSEASLLALTRANSPASIFVRRGELVHVAVDESGRSNIRSIQPNYLRGRLERAANYYRDGKGGLVPIPPPMDIVHDILSFQAADWQFSPLETLTEVPLLRPDGTILALPGYDRATKTVYVPAKDLRIPTINDRPSRDDVTDAMSELDEALSEFPFADPSSRANTLGLLLTPVVRVAIDGRVPLALIDAPQPGTGKSLLATIVAVIATGRDADMMSAPQDEDEWRKAITANLYSGTSIVIYDDLHSVLHSASLARVLTAPQWSDRMLGSTRTLNLPQLVTWIATGNNIRLGGDLARRCYWIRLDAEMSRPWTRDRFRHPNLMAWARKHRGKLLAALLTIARAWFAAGRPASDVPRIGGFQEWADMVGGMLAHAGVHGFLGNVAELYEQADDTSTQWEGFLFALREFFGENSFTVAELLQGMQSRLKEHLPEELAAAWGNDNVPSNGLRAKLGKALRKRIGTRYGTDGLHLLRSGTESRGGCVRWTVVAGLQGSTPSYAEAANVRSDVFSNGTAGTTLQTLHSCTEQAREDSVSAFELHDNVTPPERCFSCEGSRFRELRDGGWVCEVCHPMSEGNFEHR